MRLLLVMIAVVSGGCSSEPWDYRALGEGLQRTGTIVAQSVPQQQYVQPVVMPQQAPVYQPQPVQNYQIDTPGYQRFNGASPGQIRY